MSEEQMTSSDYKPTDYKRARELRGTQASVAAQLGVHKITVAKRETGAQVITREAWLALLALPIDLERPARRTPQAGT